MATLSSAASPADLPSLFGAVPVAVLTSDSDGNVVFLNRAAELLTGRSREAALGRRLEEMLPLGSEIEGTAIESPALACLRSGAPVGPFEARLLEGPLAARPVLDVSAAPIRDREGVITGAILIARDVTHARQLARQLSHQATHDALTDLVNRAEFERRLTQALESAAKQGCKHAIGFLDLDGFKRVNDVGGHLAGDELLRELSGLLRGCMRARDTVARLGGDEFGILLEHCSTATAVRIAEGIRKAVNGYRFSCGGRTYSIGVSIGIVPVRGDQASGAQLLRSADAACYQVKRRGGNRVQLTVPKKVSLAAHAKVSGSHPRSGTPRVPGETRCVAGAF